MSAQGRISTDREPRDFYPTPRSAFPDRFIPAIAQQIDTPIFEPCQGDGRLVRWMQEYGYENVTGADLATGQDYLADFTHRPIVITNPPFSVAFEIAQHARCYSDETFLLLPMGFLASAKRKEWFQAHEPSALFILSERPSFVMVVTCVTYRPELERTLTIQRGFPACDYREILAVESERPKVCPKCGSKLKITTSDACDYAWIYWGTRHSGIRHL